MKQKYKFFLLILACFDSVCCQQYKVIGSYLASDALNYKLLVISNDKKPVDVSLSTATKNIRPQTENSVEEVNFPAPRDATSDLSIKSQRKTCNLAKITRTNRPLILLQLTKPFYMAGDEFKFRIFILNQKLIPYKGTHKTEVEIFDSKGQSVKKIPKITTSSNGVYENSFQLPENLPSYNYGKWTIKVTSDDRVITKKIIVKMPNDSGIDVLLDIPETVSFADRKVYMNIYVKDIKNNFFIGTADISVRARSKRHETNMVAKFIKTVGITGNKEKVEISFDEMDIRYPSEDMNIEFQVNVKDKASQRMTKASRKVNMKYNSKNIIQTFGRTYFKPGIEYSMKIKVKNVNGSPDNSFNKLSMTVNYHNEEANVEKKSFLVDLKNGEITAPLHPIFSTKKIVVNLEFAGEKLEQIILPFPVAGNPEYLQVTLIEKSTTIGNEIKFRAESTNEMEELHVIIIGLNGIVFSQIYPDTLQKDIHTFSFKLTEDMKPEVRGIAFYIRPYDGAIIYDDFSLNLGIKIENSLEITTVETAKPGENIEINIATSNGAQVFLTVTDQISSFLTTSNEISRTDVYNELTYYLNYKFPNTSLYHFDKFNGFILESGSSCNPHNYNFEIDDGNQLPDDVNYFPDVMLDINAHITSLNDVYSIDLPESFTTWKFYGISVHPTKGLSIVKVQPKVTVKNDILLSLKMSDKVYDNETIWVEINGINTLQNSISASIDVKIENGELVDQKDSYGYSMKCVKFNRNGYNQIQLKNFNLRPKDQTAITRLPIISTSNKNIIVKVTSMTGNNKNEITGTILKENDLIDPVRYRNDYKVVVDTQPNRIIVNILLLKRELASREITIKMDIPRGYIYNDYIEKNIIKKEYINEDSLIFSSRMLRWDQPNKLTIKFIKLFDIENHRFSSISVYEKLNPNNKHTIHYRLDENSNNCDKIEVNNLKKEVNLFNDLTKEAEDNLRILENDVNNAIHNVNNEENKLNLVQNEITKTTKYVEEAIKAATDASKSAEEALNAAKQQDSQEQVNSGQESVPSSVQNQNNPQTYQEANSMTENEQKNANEVKEKLKNLNDNLAATELDMNNSQEEIKSLKQKASSIKNEINNIQNSLNSAPKKIQNFNIKIKAAQDKLHKTKSDINAAQNIADQLKQQVDDARKSVNDALKQLDVTRITPDIEQAATIARSKAENAKEVTMNPKGINQINFEQLLTEVKNLKVEYKNLRNSANNALDIAANVKEEIDKNQTELKKIQRKYNHLKGQNQTGLHKLNDIERKIEDLRTLAAQFERTERLSTTTIRTTKSSLPTRSTVESSSESTTQSTTQSTTTSSTTQAETVTNNLKVQFVSTPGPSEIHETDQTQINDDCELWFRFCNFGF